MSTLPGHAALPAALAGDIGFLLARCSAAAVRATNAGLAELGVRARHYALLQLATRADGMSQRQLAVDLGLDPSAVVSLVDDLERSGLVARTPDPTDRRTRLVVTTPAGLEFLRTAGVRVAEAMTAVTAPLDRREIEMLGTLLRKITDQLA